MELRVYNATTVWLADSPSVVLPGAAAKAVRRSTELLRRHPVLFGLLSFIAAPLGGILTFSPSWALSSGPFARSWGW